MGCIGARYSTYAVFYLSFTPCYCCSRRKFDEYNIHRLSSILRSLMTNILRRLYDDVRFLKKCPTNRRISATTARRGPGQVRYHIASPRTHLKNSLPQSRLKHHSFSFYALFPRRMRTNEVFLRVDSTTKLSFFH